MALCAFAPVDSVKLKSREVQKFRIAVTMVWGKLPTLSLGIKVNSLVCQGIYKA